MNVILSILLGLFWGINGVSVALLVSIAYRTFSQVLYLRKNILSRSSKAFCIKLIAFVISSAIVIMVSWNNVAPCDCTLLSWMAYSLRIAIIAFAVYSGTCIVLQFKSVLRVLSRFFGRR